MKQNPQNFFIAFPSDNSRRPKAFLCRSARNKKKKQGDRDASDDTFFNIDEKKDKLDKTRGEDTRYLGSNLYRGRFIIPNLKAVKNIKQKVLHLLY